MIEAVLQKLGLSDKEIQIYLTSLRLGPSSVRKIADEAEINRGTTYDILKTLRDQGLIAYYHQDKRQYFIAEDPNRLKAALQNKQQELGQLEQRIDELIPQLQSMQQRSGSKPVVKYYDGYPAISVILNDVLQALADAAVKEYYVYSSAAIKDYLYNVYPNFSKDRIRSGIRVKVLSMGPGGETRGLDERKWLTKQETTPTYTLLYAGKMAIISIDRDKKPIGVMIEDGNIYQTQKMIFDSLWNCLP